MFDALSYLDPLWYFNLKPAKKHWFYFPDLNKLEEEDKGLIAEDKGYKELCREDAIFQGLKKGIMTTDLSVAVDSLPSGETPPEDNYRFVKKYYTKPWIFYYLFIRLLRLKNPFREIRGFFKALPVKREDLYATVSSKVPSGITVPRNARISVIVPTLNRYEYLKDFLHDLSVQTIPPSEVIVIDQSDRKDFPFYDDFRKLPLNLVFRNSKGQWLARNEAIAISTGDYILFGDDDSRVKPDWIEQHLKCLLFFDCGISAGVSVPAGSPAGKDKTFFRWADEFDSGNAMVRRTVFECTGLFDRAFDGIRMGDTEFGLRAYLSGITSVSNPLAGRIHMEASTGGLREYGSVHAFRPKNFWKPRSDKGLLYLYQKYFRAQHLVSLLAVRILLSYVPPKPGKHPAGYLAALFLFVVFSPLWIAQVCFQWKQARKLSSDIPSLPKHSAS